MDIVESCEITATVAPSADEIVVVKNGIDTLCYTA